MPMPLRPDDRVLMVGDSITADGRWWTLALAHLACRGSGATWINGGIPGDRAEGVLARWAEDLAPHRATVAVVMLGMNDVEREVYGRDRHGQAWHLARGGALERHRTALRRLAERLLAGGVRRLILATPTPYDDLAHGPTPSLHGVGAALESCAGFVRDLAARLGAEVLDLNARLGAELRARLAADPTDSLIGPDRVHPEWPGHAAMAEALLAHLGGDGPWLERTLPAGTLDWTLDPVAAPAVPAGAQRPALAPRARLAVPGLAPGPWTLWADGRRVGTWDAAAWAAGIDPGVPGSPWAERGAAVLAAALAWNDAVQPLRQARMVAGWAGIPAGDLAALRRVVRRWQAGEREDMPDWLRAIADGPWFPGVLRRIDAEAAQPERGRADRSAAWAAIAAAAGGPVVCRLTPG